MSTDQQQHLPPYTEGTTGKSQPAAGHLLYRLNACIEVAGHQGHGTMQSVLLEAKDELERLWRYEELNPGGRI